MCVLIFLFRHALRDGECEQQQEAGKDPECASHRIRIVTIVRMQDVNVGIIGLGNVGSGTLKILAENGDRIAGKLGFRLNVKAVCSRGVATKELPAGLEGAIRTSDWRDVVTNPEVDIVG